VTDPAATHTLVQLTDLHIVAADEELPHGVDTAAVLAQALRAVEDSAAGRSWRTPWRARTCG
jgi:3',5'-cyclic-AMP phosphodiesterase